MTLQKSDIVEDTEVIGHEIWCHHKDHIVLANKARQELANKIADDIDDICREYIQEVNRQTGGRAGSMILAYFEPLTKTLRSSSQLNTEKCGEKEE